MKKADFVVLGVVLVLLLASMSLFKGGDRVCVIVDGKEYKTISLNENTVLNLETEYGKNTVVVNDGKVFIKESNCPNGLCLKSTISKAGQSIVCLPNRVSILIEGKTKESEADVLL